MVEATNSFRRHPTSISYVYRVVYHLDMLWMDIWVDPYTVILVWVGLIFWKVVVWVRPNVVVVSWLRLQTASEGIPHPYHMYTKLFSTLICCRWTYGCTLTLLYQCRWGWIIGKLGCGWEQMVLWCHGWGYKQLQTASHIHIICIQSVLAPWYAVDGHMGAPLHCYTCVDGVGSFESWGVGEANGIVVSWLSLQTASECIPHPYHMYTKCFRTLICCGWTYGCTLTL